MKSYKIVFRQNKINCNLFYYKGEKHMEKESAKKRIEELRKTVEYHANKYYNEDKPEISDFEYDMLMVELRNLEKQYPEFITADSLTQKVGGKVKEGFKKVEHEVPLQSLQDVFSFDEVREFLLSITDGGVTIINARGGYTNDKQSLLLGVVPTRQYFIVKQGLREIDKNIFFLACDAYEVSSRSN